MVFIVVLSAGSSNSTSISGAGVVVVVVCLAVVPSEGYVNMLLQTTLCTESHYHKLNCGMRIAIVDWVTLTPK